MHRCQQCGATQMKWSGRCNQCEAWDSLIEENDKNDNPKQKRLKKNPPAKIHKLEKSSEKHQVHSTGLNELDRTLGGGIVPGSIILISGAPGIGKSTLLLRLSESFVGHGLSTLYVSGEETISQISGRARRLSIEVDIGLISTVDVGSILSLIEKERPDVIIIDSVQTLSHSELSGSPGSIQQVRESTELLRTACKNLGVTAILVGHITKDGNVAGPKTLEHMVDVVLTMEGDPRSGLRIISSSKNRYGPANQLGILELNNEGLHDVLDPALRFLHHQEDAVPGIALGGALEGQRMFIAEIQALVIPSKLPQPRRVITGLDPKRVELLIAVLERHVGLKISSSDIFLTLVGGIRLKDPGLDLAVSLALASGAKDKALPSGLVTSGEISLTGEVRPPTQVERRMEHLEQLGFKNIIIPNKSKRAHLKDIVNGCF